MVFLVEFFFNGSFFKCPQGVYLPSEDSFLLASSVGSCSGAFALDLGCGSGIQSINLLQKGAGRVVAVDILPECLEVSSFNIKKAGFSGFFEARLSDLFSNVSEKFDVIVFNPPYVPSGKIRFVDLDGGKKGRVVLDRFLQGLSGHLSENGVCYFLQTNLNGFAITERKICSLGFDFDVVAEKALFFEKLRVYYCRLKKDQGADNV